MKKQTTPLVILSGFLGSGKTTLLTRMLEYYTNKGLRPAVIMNEVGDINFDGQLLDGAISIRELLSGCICCTIRGDLGMEIRNLMIEQSPDLILVEATGVANPVEIFEAVTEAAMLVPIEIHSMISVVDAAHFLHWHHKGTGKTYRLMEEQIRCASIILLNKADRISDKELSEAKRQAAALNPKALIYSTVYCEISNELLKLVLQESMDVSFEKGYHNEHIHEHEHGRGCTDDEHEHGRGCTYDEHDHDHSHECNHHGHAHDELHNHYHSYDHVMVHTHYFNQPIDRARLEQMIDELPENVYRAKGIFTEAGTGGRMMFQYAFRELDILRITPQGEVLDVAVFIGEQFPKQELEKKLQLCQ